MAEHPAGEGIHTVEISKTAATVMVGLVLAGGTGFAGSYWNLASSHAVLVEQVAHLKQFAAAGDRCTSETCRHTRESLERLRSIVLQHHRDAEEWKQRIVVCESRVSDCTTCMFEFGVKNSGGSR